MKEYKLTINGNKYAVAITNLEDSIAEVEVNGTPFKVEIEKTAKDKPVSVIKMNKPAQVDATVSRPANAGGETIISSPLPGVILEVVVQEGDTVKRGQKLMVLEAMKMENAIEATADGKVISVKANKGDSVLEGAALIIIG
ncbi:MAG: biotin/lipoyl-containing protein [Bacteroidales bacterium]